MSGLFTTTADSDARFVSFRGDPQFAGYELQREWEKIHASYADSLIVALNDTEIYTNPKADQEEYTGTFVNTRIDPQADNEDAVTIKQILTKVKASTDSNDADLFQITGNPKISGTEVQRDWHYIDPTKSDTLYTALNAITSYNSGIKVNKQLYSGKFIVSKVVPIEESDRTVTIRQQLVKVNVVTSDIADLAALTPTITQDNEILKLFDFEEGEGDNIVYVYKNIDPANRSICMDYSDSDLVTNLPGAGWSYLERRFKEEDDNTGTFAVAFKKTEWTNSTGSSPNKAINTVRIFQHTNYDPKNDKAGIRRGKVDGGRGIPIADVEEIRDNQKADAGWAIKGVSIAELGNGEASLKRFQIKKRATDSSYETFFRPATGVQSEAEQVDWHDLADSDALLIYNDAKANRNDMGAATYATADTGHVLQSIGRPIQTGVDSVGNNLFGVTRTTYKPRVTWSAPLNQEGEVVGWRYQAARFRVVDGYGFTDTFPRVVRTDRKITSSVSSAKTWADAGSKSPTDSALLSYINYLDGYNLYASYKVLVSDSYSHSTPFASADAANSWLPS